mmetsp:Transcript_37222/g.60266  ORF Transcript_37222/g.60266 Transcript_37222/m.60266 type:complete len:483 (+) Transcript_37222:306-1754(+)
MTSVRLSKDTEPAPDDSVQKRYTRMRAVASELNLIQVGISLFHVDPHVDPQSPEAYIARPYNFYVFPDEGPIGFNPRVNMEASGIAFNKRHKMDFNNWVYNGVTYVTAEGEAAFEKQILIGDDGSLKRKEVVLTKEADQKALADLVQGIEKWAASGNSAEKEFKVPGSEALNSFMRLALYQEVERRYPELVCEGRPLFEGDRYKIQVFLLRINEQEKAERKCKQEEEQRKKLLAKLGFRRVFKLLAASKRPIVFHNGLFDLLFLYTHFEGNLPEDVNAFKTKLHSLFPEVYDTKVIATSDLFGRNLPEFPNTALEELFVATRNSTKNGTGHVRIQLGEGFERYAGSSGAFHEAGYDAYVTGCVFAQLEPRFREVRERFKNRVYLLRSVLQFNVTGADEQAEPKAIIHVSNFPKDTDTAGLLAIFDGLESPVRIQWINDTSAFAIIDDQSKLSQAVSIASSRTEANVIPAAEFFANSADKVTQ